MVGHDIFALSAAGFEQGLEAYLELLPDAVREGLLDGVDGSKWKSHIKTLEEADAVQIRDVAELILHGGRLDRDQLEPILEKNKIEYGNKDSTHALIYELIEKVGAEKALVRAWLADPGTHARVPRTTARLIMMSADALVMTIVSEAEPTFHREDRRRPFVRPRSPILLPRMPERVTGDRAPDSAGRLAYSHRARRTLFGELRRRPARHQRRLSKRPRRPIVEPA